MTTFLQAIDHPSQLETRRLINGIRETHPNLEKLCLVRALCDISNKTLFTIGTSGGGKTVSQKWLKSCIRRQLIEFQAVGISSFKAYNDRMQAEPSTILIEDLSVAKTIDIMIKTAFFLTHMAFEHRLVRPIQPYPIEIYKFDGSVQIDMQPYIFTHMTMETEFETDIKDKAIRWYHLRMPLEAHIQPSSTPPSFKMSWKYTQDVNVKTPDGLTKLANYRAMLHNFLHAYTEGRAREHALDLLKALAILNNRKEIHKTDVLVLEHLSRNFRVELEIFQKAHLEGVRVVNPDILPILSILSTYKAYEVSKLMLHFQVKRTQIYNILNGISDYVLTTGKNSSIIATEYTKNLLKELGES